MASWITAIIFCFTMLVFSCIQSCLFTKPQFREASCFRIFSLVTSSFAALMAVAMITTCSYNSSFIDGRVNAFKGWSEYSDCVDSYMQVNSYQVGEVEKAKSGITAQLALSVFVLVF